MDHKLSLEKHKHKHTHKWGQQENYKLLSYYDPKPFFLVSKYDP